MRVFGCHRRLLRYGALCLCGVMFVSGLAWADKPPRPARKPAAEVRDPIGDILSADGVASRPARKPADAAAPETAPAPAPQKAASAPPPVPAPKPKGSIINRVIGHITGARRLGEEDAARYAHIFAFQDVGEMAHANTEIARLKDDRLMGHVLLQRYLGPYYKASYRELADWMQKYGDHPGAQRVYDLALSRQPKGAGALARPRTTRGVIGQQDYDVGQLAQPYLRAREYSGRAADIVRSVRANLSKSPGAAASQMNSDEARQVFNEAERDALRGDVAASYFFNGHVRQAYDYASASARRTGADVPQAAWIAGLAAWRLNRYEEAAGYFEITANSPRSSAWMNAAGSYWAARSYLRARHPQKVGYWLRRAAEFPRTFYGIISLKALGMEQAKFNWQVPELSDRHIKALSSLPAGRRAIALVDAERPDFAEQELRQINPGSDYVMQEAMVTLATHHGMPLLAMRMGSAFRDRKGDLYDAALYPSAPWEPQGGFSVDRALVYAFIRQESKFDPAANNKSSGAQGLMQIMPATAKHVARGAGENLDENRLRDPEVNIDIGQRYLAELLSLPVVDGNLFKLAVAYNAGPGKLARWQQTVPYEDDPLLFIEAIPVAETRVFVERVLTNYWIYRLKFNQNTPSLDRVVEGSWPLYSGQD